MRTHLLGAVAALATATAAPVHAGPLQDIASMNFTHQPAGDGEGRFVVTLDDEGNWSTIEKLTTHWTISFQVIWNNAPENIYGAIFYVKPFGWGSDFWGDSPGAFAGHARTRDGFMFWGGTPAVLTIGANTSAAFPPDAIPSDPAGICFFNRKNKLDAGMSLNEVLSTDWEIAHQVLATAEFKYGGYPPEHTISTVAVLPVTVVCKGDPALADALDPPPEPPQTADDVAAGFQVTDASLVLFPGYNGEEHACPVDLTMFGKIKAVGLGPAEVSYRFRWASGPVSTVFTTTIHDTAEDKDVSHQVSIPLPDAIQPPSQGGGGPAAPQGMGGFAPQPGPGDGLDLPPPAPEPQLTGAQIPGNVHKDSIRLEIVAPTKAVASDWQAYHVVCKPSVTPGLEPPDTVGIEPQQPTSSDAPKVAMPGGRVPDSGGTRRTDAVPAIPGAAGDPRREPTAPSDSSVAVPGSAASVGEVAAPTR